MSVSECIKTLTFILKKATENFRALIAVLFYVLLSVSRKRNLLNWDAKSSQACLQEENIVGLLIDRVGTCQFTVTTTHRLDCCQVALYFLNVLAVIYFFSARSNCCFCKPLQSLQHYETLLSSSCLNLVIPQCLSEWSEQSSIHTNI